MPKELKEGDRAPDFTLENARSEPVSLSDFVGRWVVLYFYPRDNTSGCTREAIEFSDALPEFESMDASVIGISPDSQASHAAFIEKHGLRVELLSDPDKEVCTLYGVWRKKRMGKREYMGVVRTTFLIDPEGIIYRIWKNVRVAGHVQRVYDFLPGK